MVERFKTVLLAGLILLSLYLTYILWFGSPYLEEAVLPRYEYAYFTPPPTPDMLLPPAAVIVLHRSAETEEEPALFPRGTAGQLHIWRETYVLLQNNLPNCVKCAPPEEPKLDSLLRESPWELLFRFNPPLPTYFLGDHTTFPASDIYMIRLFADRENCYVCLDGEEKIFCQWGKQEEWNPGCLLPARAVECGLNAEKVDRDITLQVLSGDHDSGRQVFITPFTGSPVEKTDPAISEPPTDYVLADPGATEKNIGENGLQPEVEPAEQWTIAVRGDIYLPTELFAGELTLIREGLDSEELFNAFFLDPAMARRIEERDGALYLTDGKRGLRLYADGAIEYTAPGLESFSGRLDCDAALLEAAGNQSLYGGWPDNAFLDKREITAGSHRFFWHTYYAGIPLVTEETSCEMVINDRGMPYYRRNFYVITGNIEEPRPYAYYGEALWQAISLHQDKFQDKRAALLGLEPVYRVVEEATGAKAVPAWAVHFAETGRIFLHWQTLTPL